jgi:hypothetical protein
MAKEAFNPATPLLLALLNNILIVLLKTSLYPAILGAQILAKVMYIILTAC